MKAQTYLDVTRGIRLIDEQITSALFGNDEQKASIADAAGALATAWPDRASHRDSPASHHPRHR